MVIQSFSLRFLNVFRLRQIEHYKAKLHIIFQLILTNNHSRFLHLRNNRFRNYRYNCISHNRNYYHRNCINYTNLHPFFLLFILGSLV